MTGYTVHTGASKKFVAGWDNIFGDKSKQPSSGKKKSAKARKKSTTASTAKKKSKKKKSK